MIHTHQARLASFRIGTVALLFLVVVFGLLVSSVHAETGAIERSESIVLHTGDWVLVSSSARSLQLVEIQGNLSAAKFSSPQQYPSNSFNLTSSAQGHYLVRLTFSSTSDYKTRVSVNGSNGSRAEEAAYYVSSGQLLLTIDLDFSEPEPITTAATPTVWESFVDWTARFGDAFPLWVKLLYMFMGLQYAAVGYEWIRFEGCTRESNSMPSRFDKGNLVYLWSEVFWKFLLTAFIVIAAAMGGQFILVSLLRFMFLAQVNMLSLWDVFVLGFAAGMAGIAYAFRLCLEKSFDLKPLFQD